MRYQKSLTRRERNNMRYYIDVGTHNGELLEKVIDRLEDFDFYIGFEPVPELFQQAQNRFKDNPNSGGRWKKIFCRDCQKNQIKPGSC